jgi:serine/threonine-protein kinase PRP4
MNNRYKVLGHYGKGVFGQVLKVQDTTIPESLIFAVKVSRSNDTMYVAPSIPLPPTTNITVAIRKRAAETERDFLLLLKERGRIRNVVSLHDSFEYKKHLCLVLEPMTFNLREVIQNFGGGVGITLKAVRFYSLQLLNGLRHLKQSNILHADIKPDNIVVRTDLTCRYSLSNTHFLGSGERGQTQTEDM